ncbi:MULTISPECIES: ERF family protein [unclassified Streptomyces]|uniref:ERF family protein n=1 Tax=unclassified Streptomyces TaxID=2593676 RepID=UPI0035DBA111
MAEATTETPTLTVDQAMIEVMREIGPVGKNGRNTHHGYDFRAQEDIVAAARGPMARHGLRMLPRVISHQHFTRGPMNVAILEVEYTFRGPAGDTMPPILVIGEGADPSDKATNKAMTAAKKYGYIQAFEIADGAEDGDRDSPVAVRNPLDWYIERLDRADVWQNAKALHNLLERATAAGHDGLHMPDRPEFTLRQVIEVRGQKLLEEEQERKTRRAAEAAAVRAQMSVEYPTPPDLYEDEWSQAVPASSRPPVAQSPQPSWSPPPALTPPTPTPVPAQTWTAPPQQPPAPPLPDAGVVERQLSRALSDPSQAEQQLHALRAQYGAAPLSQTVINSDWGPVDANSAITMALMSVARPAPVTPPTPTPAQPQESAPTPQQQPQRGKLSEPRRIRTQMGAEERARANMISEVQFQAQMLGLNTLEFVAHLLPEGGTEVDDILGGVRLHNLILENRPKVINALIEKNLSRAAEEYEAFGERVPARNIAGFIDGLLKSSS